MIALVLAAAVQIGPGTYHPQRGADVAVRAFWLDVEPVTNAQFLAFVQAHPAWRRDQVKPLFADATYLAHWAGRPRPNAPVVYVSWFAARAYCTARGGRLPTEAEWELAASPEDPQAVLAWYAKPAPKVLPDVGGPPNAFGVRDLFGLAWEWIDDFSASLAGVDPATACGAEAVGAKDPGAYATFMRMAFRGSLEATFTLGTLGFRCAYDEVPR